MDEKSYSISYQNQSHLAFQILQFNADVGDKIDPKELIELTLRLTRVAVAPSSHIQKQIDQDKASRAAK